MVVWGIDGPAFLAGYLLLALVVVARAVVVRLASGRVPSPTRAVELASDAAYLNGGRRLAVLAALAALRVDELVEALDGRLVQASGTAGSHRDPVERAVHEVAAQPAQVHTLAGRRVVAAELDAVADRLGAAGLLDEPGPTRAVRRVWWAPAAVAVLGGAWVAAGLAAGAPVAPVVLVAVAVALAAGVLALAPRRRTRTRAADAELHRLRARYRHLTPAMAPSWRTYGAEGAAMGVALYGEAALWMAEPTFAAAILTGSFAGGGARRPRRTSTHGSDMSWALLAAGSSDGGGCGGGGGFDGGGGGGCGGGGC